MTQESRSKSITTSLIREPDGVYRFIATYINEPLVELQNNRSKIHHGSFSLQLF